MLDTLVGRVIASIDNKGDELIFHMQDGTKYRMYHSQDCCENVSLDDVIGDFNDIIGAPLLTAEEVSSEGRGPKGVEDILSTDYAPESYTWTFYKFATIKGYVDLRWYGESNGYYSESVSFSPITKDE